MSYDVPWLRYRGSALRVACPRCGIDACHVQTVAVSQRGLDVAVARQTVLAVDGAAEPCAYCVEVRFFCDRGHRFAIQHLSGNGAMEIEHIELPANAGLPMLELET